MGMMADSVGYAHAALLSPGDSYIHNRNLAAALEPLLSFRNECLLSAMGIYDF